VFNLLYEYLQLHECIYIYSDVYFKSLPISFCGDKPSQCIIFLRNKSTQYFLNGIDNEKKTFEWNNNNIKTFYNRPYHWLLSDVIAIIGDANNKHQVLKLDQFIDQKILNYVHKHVKIIHPEAHSEYKKFQMFKKLST